MMQKALNALNEKQLVWVKGMQAMKNALATEMKGRSEKLSKEEQVRIGRGALAKFLEANVPEGERQDFLNKFDEGIKAAEEDIAQEDKLIIPEQRQQTEKALRKMQWFALGKLHHPWAGPGAKDKDIPPDAKQQSAMQIKLAGLAESISSSFTGNIMGGFKGFNMARVAETQFSEMRKRTGDRILD
jgi:hypothetical protein